VGHFLGEYVDGRVKVCELGGKSEEGQARNQF